MLFRSQDQSVAYIPRDGKVRRVVLDTGASDDKVVEIRSAAIGNEILDISGSVQFLDPAAGRTEGDPFSE